MLHLARVASTVIAITCCAADPPPEKQIHVAVYADIGSEGFVDGTLASLKERPNLGLETITVADIRGGSLERCDVLILPGGSGGGQGRALGEEGREAVRAFVREGGGYVGICAGAYLATCEYDWALRLLDATVVDDEHWARGVGRVELTSTARGRELLGLAASPIPVHYENGPLLGAAGAPDIADFESLATFRSEIAGNGAPGGVMPGTTAIAAGRFGAGRVLCFSPHPEKPPAPRDLLYKSVMWTAKAAAEDR